MNWHKALISVGVFISIGGSFVTFGGTGKQQYDCQKTPRGYYNQDTYSFSDCARAFQYFWWGTFFTFFLSLFVLAAGLFEKSAWYPTLQALLAACLSVCMIDAQAAIDRAWGNSIVELDAQAAGFGIICIGEFLLIIVLGPIFEHRKVKPQQADEPQRAEAA